ncbi:MAG TPA: DUF6457 domain-containing protein [Candidatus Eisenbacteria bacterium]|nr:DUF6457 domain-containing protein [Candidatus Eisenbacteria bacterium]
MNRFFDELGQSWVAAAERRSAKIDAPALDAKVALELLDLARVAARTQERRFAPLSCYMAGIATERLRVANGSIDDAAVAAFILEVRQELEKEYPAPV